MFKIIKINKLIIRNNKLYNYNRYFTTINKEKDTKKKKLHYDGNNFNFRMLLTKDFYVFFIYLQSASSFKLFCKQYGITAFILHNVLYYGYYYGIYWLLENGINVKKFLSYFYNVPHLAPIVNSVAGDTRAASLAIATVLTTVILPVRILVTCVVTYLFFNYK